MRASDLVVLSFAVLASSCASPPPEPDGEFIKFETTATLCSNLANRQFASEGLRAGWKRELEHRQAGCENYAQIRALDDDQAARTARKEASDQAAIANIQRGIQMMNPPAGQQQRSSVTGFLKRQYTSGANRICIYDRLGSETAVTIGMVEICPLTI